MSRRWTRRQLSIPPQELAPALLGQRLVRVIDGERLSGIIVETEAYLGAEDLAAHTSGGRRTRRNEVMYGPAGLAYVYFTYGMHHCMNVVCGAVDEGVAVLLRALEPTEGLERMRAARAGGSGREIPGRLLTSGPARLCQALSVDLRLNGLDLTTSDELFLERTRWRPRAGERVAVGPRIGVAYAEAWAERPLRWRIAGNPHVSVP